MKLMFMVRDPCFSIRDVCFILLITIMFITAGTSTLVVSHLRGNGAVLGHEEDRPTVLSRIDARSPTVWNSDLTLLEDFTLPEGETLVIEPGVTVSLAAGVSIRLNGIMKANGTEGSPIIFMPLNEGDNWGSIEFNPTSAPATGENRSSMDHCSVRAATHGLYCSGSAPRIANVTVTDSDVSDICLENEAHLQVLNTHFDHSKVMFDDVGSRLSVNWFLHIDVLDRCPAGVAAADVIMEEYDGTECGRTAMEIPGSLNWMVLKECDYYLEQGGNIARQKFTSHRIVVHTDSGMVKQHRVYMDSTKTLRVSLGFSSDIGTMLSEMNKMDFEATIHDLTDFPSRHVSAPEKLLAAEYIFERFNDLDRNNIDAFLPGSVNSNPFIVEFQNNTHYNLLLDNGTLIDEVEIVNVIATLPGTNMSSDREYIITAHYDSHDLDVPGADDDASGIAGMIESARVLSQYRFEDTIRFVAFDSEEEDYLGSYDYVEAAWLRGDNIMADLQLDMIGYNNDTDYHCVVWCNNQSVWLGDKLRNVSADYALGLNLRVHNDPIHRNSDHRAFWDYGYSAVEMIEHEDIPRWNPFYHTTEDLVDIINLTEVTKISQLALATTAELARVSNTPPTAPGNILPDITHNRTPIPTWIPSIDPDPDNIEYHVTIGSKFGYRDIVFEEITRFPAYEITGVNLSYGRTYYVEIYATDGNGGLSPIVFDSFEVLNTPPVLAPIGEKIVFQDVLLVFNVTAEDGDRNPVDRLTFGENSDMFDIDAETGTVEWHPENGDVGFHRVNFTVSDGNGGSDHEVVNITVHNVNDAPVLLFGVPGITFLEDNTFMNAFNLDDHFSDLDRDPLEYIFSGNDGIAPTIHENGTVDLAAPPDWFGEANVTVTAGDPYNATAECTFPVTVLAVNDPPVLEHMGDVTVREGETVIIQPNANDVDSAFLKFTYSGDMTDDTWITGYSDAGTYKVNVSVSDGEVSISQKISVVVRNVNRAPVALAGKNRTVRSGETVLFDASRSFDPDIDNDTVGENLTYRWEFGEGKMDEGKVVSHRFGKSGEYIVMLTVTDGNNATDTYNLTITVEEVGGGTSFYLYFGIAGVIVVLFGVIVVLFLSYVNIRRISTARRERDMLSSIWVKEDLEDERITPVKPDGSGKTDNEGGNAGDGYEIEENSHR